MPKKIWYKLQGYQDNGDLEKYGIGSSAGTEKWSEAVYCITTVTGYGGPRSYGCEGYYTIVTVQMVHRYICIPGYIIVIVRSTRNV
jgi:hypothetical protein